MVCNMPAAAIIGAAASILGNIMQHRQNKRLQEQGLQMTNEINQKNWRMQNFYNSPSAQMARLKAAGLNPNLIYANGADVGNAQEVGNAQAFQPSAPDYSSAIARGVDIYTAQKQADSVSAAIARTEAETESIKQDTLQKIEDNKNLSRFSLARLRQSENLGAMYSAQSNLMSQQKDYYKSLTGYTDQQINLAQIEYNKIEQEIKTLESQQHLNNRTASQLRHVIAQIDRNTDLISKQIQKTAFENWFQSYKQSAYKNSSVNYYDLEIKQLREVIDDLQFHNSDVWREWSTAGEWQKKMNWNRGNHKYSKDATKNPYNQYY